jgi:hypothetical protein
VAERPLNNPISDGGTTDFEKGTATTPFLLNAGRRLPAFDQSDQLFMRALALAIVRAPQIETLAPAIKLPELLGTKPEALQGLPVAASAIRFTAAQAAVVKTRCARELRTWERISEATVISNVTQLHQALANVLTERAVESALGSTPGVDLQTTQSAAVGTALLGLGLSFALKSFDVFGEAAAAGVGLAADLIFNMWADQQALAEALPT